MSRLHVLDGDLKLGRPLDYPSLKWSRPIWPTGTAADLETELRAQDAVAAGLQIGSYVVVRDGTSAWPVYRVDAPEWDSGESGAGTVRVTARSLAKVIGDRAVVKPESGLLKWGTSAHDSQANAAAETALKHYWTDYAASGAPSSRQWPNLTIEAGQSRGESVTVDARGQTLGVVSERAAKPGGIGWEIVYRLNERDFQLRTIHGTAKPNVVLSVDDLETATRIRRQDDELGPNVAYVLGQGEGAARAVAVVWIGSTEPVGDARRETVVDARDLSETAALAPRGLARLREGVSDDESILIDVNPYGTLRYGIAYDRGDIVTARHDPWDWSSARRIVGATVTDSGAGLLPQVEVGRPWPKVDELADDTTEQVFE